MSDEDLASVVVFIRSLPPMVHPLAASDVIFPVKYLMRSAPKPVTNNVVSPDPADRVAWGRYLVTMAGCADCHTPALRGTPIKGMEFAGGYFFKGAWGSATSANITSDPSGISYYTENLFVQAIRTGYVGARPLSPIMPYEFYRGMTDDDLKAIFAYLRTISRSNTWWTVLSLQPTARFVVRVMAAAKRIKKSARPRERNKYGNDSENETNFGSNAMVCRGFHRSRHPVLLSPSHRLVRSSLLKGSRFPAVHSQCAAIPHKNT